MIFSSIIPHDVERYSRIEELCLFDMALSESGWDKILIKKDVIRDWKYAEKKGGYRLACYEGDAIVGKLDFISEKHIERWKFDNVNSLFNNQNRKRVFGCYLENKIFLKLEKQDDWLAYLYGMRYNNVLMFHTPVINIKYLKNSPLKVLIAETFKYCRENDIKILDFGLGLEEYKKRYSNDHRKVFTYFYPKTIKAKVFSIFYLRDDFEAIYKFLLNIRKTWPNMKFKIKQDTGISVLYIEIILIQGPK
jgi:hypothetical protein